MNRILGLDLSLRCSGICLSGYKPTISDGWTHYPQHDVGMMLHKSDSKTSKWTVWYRMREFLKTYVPSCKMVVIEDYAYGATGRGVVDLGELGGIVRYTLGELGIEPVLVAPGTLKKFMSDKGNLPGDMVLKEVLKRWKLDITSKDLAMAFTLVKFGQTVLGENTHVLTFQQKVVDQWKIKNTEKKQGTKKIKNAKKR